MSAPRSAVPVEIGRPLSLAEALALAAERRVVPVAGGTDLIVRNRRGAGIPVDLGAPALFIAHLDELRKIEIVAERRVAPAERTDSERETDETAPPGDRNGTDSPRELVIGAAVTLAELGESQHCPPSFRPAIAQFASPGVRSNATVGGNVCNASPAADLLPLLYAHRARCTVRSVRGERSVPISALITGPGRTDLAMDELLVSVHIPIESNDRSEDRTYSFYRKVAARRSNALSKLSLYVTATFGGDAALADLRVSLGAVAPRVVSLPGVERLFRGIAACELAGDDPVPAVSAALSAYSHAITPIDDQRSTADYRKRTALRLIEFVLTEDLPAAMRGESAVEES